jgi:hypothetical protein
VVLVGVAVLHEAYVGQLQGPEKNCRFLYALAGFDLTTHSANLHGGSGEAQDLLPLFYLSFISLLLNYFV